MIKGCRRAGILGHGKEIIEPTSGNTGIALAFVAAARGLQADAHHARDMRLEASARACRVRCNPGADPGRGRHAGAIRRAESTAAAEPNRYFLPQQIQEPSESAHPRANDRARNLERHRRRHRRVGIRRGHSGTITGVSRYIKKTKGKAITSVAVEPTASPVLTQTRAGRPLQPGKHKIQGIGAGFVPDTLDLSIVDRVELATDEESIETARRLASEEGILSGISSGAATAVALRLAKLNEFAARPSSWFA